MHQHGRVLGVINALSIACTQLGSWIPHDKFRSGTGSTHGIHGPFASDDMYQPFSVGKIAERRTVGSMSTHWSVLTVIISTSACASRSTNFYYSVVVLGY